MNKIKNKKLESDKLLVFINFVFLTTYIFVYLYHLIFNDGCV